MEKREGGVMDYSQLSDFEINKRVAQLHGGFALTLAVHEEPPSEKAFNPGRFDPCNNPADAWPIIVENLIALRPVALHVGGHRWFATKGEGDFGMKYADDNPLRAAMVVFLMMQEQEND